MPAKPSENFYRHIFPGSIFNPMNLGLFIFVLLKKDLLFFFFFDGEGEKGGGGVGRGTVGLLVEVQYIRSYNLYFD